MALVLFSGTKLESQPVKQPLNKVFLFAVGFLYLIALHLFTFSDSGESLFRSSNLISWLMIAFILAIGLKQLARTSEFRYSKLSIGLLLCCSLITFPIFEHQTNTHGALLRIFAVWIGLLLFLVLQQFRFNNKQTQSLLWFIVLSSLIESVIIYTHAYLTWVQTGELKIHSAYLGAFPTKESLYSFLITGVLASAYLLARQAKKYQLRLSAIVLLYLVPLLVLPIITFINSSIAWGVLIISLGACSPYLIRFANQKRLLTWFIVLVISLLASISTSVLSPNINNYDKTTDANPILAHKALPQIIDMFVEKPFTGYGYGRFEEQYVLYSARQHQLNAQFSPPIPNLTHPQNELLFWGIEGGLIPLSALILAGLFIAGRNYLSKKGTRLATASLLFPIILTSQVSDVLYQSHIHWITLIFLLYWLDQRVTKYRIINMKKWSSKIIDLTSKLLPLLLGLFIATLGYNRYILSQYEKTKTPELLDEIYFPLSYQNEVTLNRVKYQIDQNKPFSQIVSQKYINKLLKIIKQHPSPEHYQALILLYQMNQDFNKELQTRMEAKFLFPDMHFLFEGPSQNKVP